MKRIKPIVRWPGGKSRLLQHILPLPEHTTYVEPFAGGLAVLLAKPRSPVEIVNDLNDELVCLYRVAQFHLDALVQELEFMVHSRKNMKDWVEQRGLTDIQRAARFLSRNRSSFAANGVSYAVVKGTGGGLPSRQNVLALLKAFNERMDRVSIENLSYERCLELYDSPGTLFFLDPPYLNSNSKNYRGWNEFEMTRFATQVLSLKGKWVVTVDDSPLNRQLFEGCEITSLQTRNGCVNHRIRPTQTFGEIVIRADSSGAEGGQLLAA